MRFLDYVSINPKISLEKERIYPFVEMGDVSTSFRNPDKVEYKSFDSGVKFADGDTVIARITPCLQNGKRFYCKNIGKGFGSTEYLVFRPKDSSVDNLYLYYFMNTDFIKESMVRSMVGATGRQRVNNDVFSRLDVTFPNIEIQRRIAEILSTYDDLIENNRKQIKLLEEAAQRLYKEWFVDLRFPGHETTPIVDGVPEGWRSLYLQEIVGYEIGGGWGEETPTEKCDYPAYVIRGTDLSGITHGSALTIPFRYHSKHNLDARTLTDGDIVFEVSGGSKTEGVARTALIRSAMLELWQYPVMCASFCKLIRAKNTKHSQVLFDAFRYMRASGKTSEYDKKSASSIVNYRWKDFLSNESILMPTDELLEIYNSIVGNMYQMIVQKSITIEKAKEARDRLLPKLMSGEIEV